MPTPSRFGPRFRPSVAWVLLCVLLVVLLLAGGASRADALGQAVVRGVAWIALMIVALFGERPSLGRTGPVLFLLAGTIVLALLQLVPLPPSLWSALPGRAFLTAAAAASGQAQPWRPLSMVPDATVNAAGSLVVPAAILILANGLTPAERLRLPGLVLCLVAGSALTGLLQVSIPGFGNVLIDDVPGTLSGSFANRNHFSLFLALGCLVVPVWAFLEGRRPHWRGPVGFALLLLFMLLILATGSRAGIGLGALALALGLVLARHGIGHELARYPRWMFPALIAAMAGVIAVFVLISLASDRAASIDRVLAIDPGQDMRGRALPTVWAMIRTYFPVGSGFGGFDPVFRIHEPLALLNRTYFNHAHDDLLEVVLDGGLPALLLLLGGLVWWLTASIRAWRAGSSLRHALPKLGSAMLLLVFIASVFDYPARTPMVMAVVVLAALWLADAPARARH